MPLVWLLHIAACGRRHKRFKSKLKIPCNARMGLREWKQSRELEVGAKQLPKNASANLNLSARAYDGILKVARTIADLAGSEKIQSDHISEAIQSRSLDRQIWARSGAEMFRLTATVSGRSWRGW